LKHETFLESLLSDYIFSVAKEKYSKEQGTIRF